MENSSRLFLVLLLLLLLLVVLTACGKKEQPAADTQPLKITFAGGSPSGFWYMVSNGVAECINRSYPGSVVTVVPGSGVGNITRINNRQVDLGLTSSNTTVDAMAGSEPFNEKLTNIAAVASLYPTSIQIVVSKELDITSVEDIFARKMKIRLSADQAGSNTELVLRRLLAEYGLTYKDIKEWGGEIIFKDMTDSSTMLSDGLIDGFMISSLYPAPTIQEIAVSKELVLLSVNPAMVEKFSQKYGYTRGIIPANTYSFNDRDITTLNANALILMPGETQDEVAYKVTRSIVENLEYLKTVHSALGGLTPDKLVQGTGIPLHKGAEKYYREIGVIK
jgi:TRAP transporter TAXI family solute receptor